MVMVAKEVDQDSNITEFSVLVAGGGWERRQMIGCSRWRDEVADPATAELLLLCVVVR